jgi:hypothetical protein
MQASSQTTMPDRFFVCEDLIDQQR